MNQDIDEEARRLARAIASWYVSKDSKFFRVDAPGTPISRPDLYKSSYARILNEFKDLHLDKSTLNTAFKLALAPMSDDPSTNVKAWSGQVISRPGVPDRLIEHDGFVSINQWREPPYRQLRVNHYGFGATGELLEWMIPCEGTRRHVIDWIAWNLQNEHDRPTWSLFLHSKAKGTGKSQLCRVLEALFGENNTAALNGISKLTGRFTVTTLMSKLVICEEVKLKQGSSAANDLKTLISERRTTVEPKGREAYQTDQFCCFVFTTNHIPLWLEGNDRRYYVIDVDHEGHASGSRSPEFQEVIGRVNEQVEDQASLGALYNAFMTHEVSDSFNAKSLNTQEHTTPIMRTIADNSQQASTEQLREWLDERGHNAISQSDLIQHFQEARLNEETIRHKMLELGWHRQTAKWGGVDYGRVIWIRPGYSFYRGEVRGPDGVSKALEPDFEIEAGL